MDVVVSHDIMNRSDQARRSISQVRAPLSFWFT